MKVIKPTPTTDANLYAGVGTEPSTYDQYRVNGIGALVNPVNWDSTYVASTYTAGQRVYRTQTHRIYEALGTIAANTNKPPETMIETPGGLGVTATWLEVAPTNKWAMFDSVINSATKAVGFMFAIVSTSQINSVALFGLIGTEAQVILRSGAYPGTVVYGPVTINLQGSKVTDWYDYFFSEFRQIDQAVLTDLPVYFQGNLEVSITGADVAIGQMAVGFASQIGETEYGSSSGIVDYSVKTINAFGNSTFVERAYSKRMSAKVWMSNDDVDSVQTRLASVRATPCVWVGTEETKYNNLVVYGFYKDFTIDVQDYSASSCTLEIEGLV